MPPHTSAKTGLEIDHAAHTIRLVRSFDAPATLVFEAWTKPEHIRCWWDAAGDPLSVCEIDLRPGGAFLFVSRSHPEMPFGGTYLEIESPNRLIFEALHSTGRVIFTSAGGKTRMTVEIICQSAEQLEQFLKMGVDAGTSQTLDNLVNYIQRQGVAA
ncbi:MAG TPA: SRPBCC domain-containing protein [Rhizomicrobium sp.]|nr:SRPBCC domain-containing protein [Rhizomicrobium sp.]